MKTLSGFNQNTLGINIGYQQLKTNETYRRTITGRIMFRCIVSRVIQVFSRRARNARSFTATGRIAVLTRCAYFAIRLTQLILKRAHTAIVAITHSRRGLLCTLGTSRTRCFGRRRLPAHRAFFARRPITGVVKPRFAFNAG